MAGAGIWVCKGNGGVNRLVIVTDQNGEIERIAADEPIAIYWVNNHIMSDAVEHKRALDRANLSHP